MKKVSFLVSNTVLATPVDAEAYEYPAMIAEECQAAANELNRPVTLLGKNSDKFTFNPTKKK